MKHCPLFLLCILLSVKSISAQDNFVAVNFERVVADRISDYDEATTKFEYGIGLGHYRFVKKRYFWKNNLRYIRTAAFDHITTNGTSTTTAEFGNLFTSNVYCATTGFGVKMNTFNNKIWVGISPHFGLMIQDLQYEAKLDYEFGFDSYFLSSDYYKLNPLYSLGAGGELTASVQLSQVLSCQLSILTLTDWKRPKSVSWKEKNENPIEVFPPAIQQKVEDVRLEPLSLAQYYAISWKFGVAYKIK